MFCKKCGSYMDGKSMICPLCHYDNGMMESYTKIQENILQIQPTQSTRLNQSDVDYSFSELENKLDHVHMDITNLRKRTDFQVNKLKKWNKLMLVGLILLCVISLGSTCVALTVAKNERMENQAEQETMPSERVTHEESTQEKITQKASEKESTTNEKLEILPGKEEIQ